MSLALELKVCGPFRLHLRSWNKMTSTSTDCRAGRTSRMRTIPILLLLCACVGADLFKGSELKNKAMAPIGEKIREHWRNFLKDMKQHVKSKVLDFRHKLEKFKGKIKERLTLTKKQLVEVARRLKEVKRTIVNQIQMRGERAMRVFRRAAKLWMDNTCIDIFENSSATEAIRVIGEGGCSSTIGKYKGLQNLTLGRNCEARTREQGLLVVQVYPPDNGE
ncbi:unnamed protein product [Nippostrongylus brasiliensis]|uniref:Astacin domain-containing protein n=1 Tax=Nippostrongylus brasiliensis TaxID=27835 RepID=A0A0N4YFP2_NIPBR|nr:unnamed protein product [Nippostrongylus brasiliensis]